MLSSFSCIACAAITIAACGFSPLASEGDGGIDPPLVTVGFRDTMRLEDESSGTFTIPVVVSAASEQPIRVDFSITGGTASRDVDYMMADGTLVFSPGDTMTEIVLAILPDDAEEPNETIEISLSSPTGPAVLGASVETITINSNVLPRVSFLVKTSSANEDATTTLIATLNATSVVPITVDYLVSGTSTTADRALVDGTLSFPAGVMMQQLELRVVNDLLDEDDETAIVRLDNPASVVLGTVSEQIHTILDDDPMPLVGYGSSISSQGEAIASGGITVALSAPSGRVVTVQFARNGGTAGVDDVTLADTGLLTFAPGVTTQGIPMTLIDDALNEASETVQVDLSTPDHATLGATVHTLTILDDDPLPVVAFDAQPDGVWDEGNDGTKLYDYRVVLSTASGRTVIVPITVTGNARTPMDYTVRPGDIPVVFNPGQTSRTIQLRVKGERKKERDEAITMTIPTAGITNAVSGTPSVRYHVIRNDD